MLLDGADSDAQLSLIGVEEFIHLGCSLFLSVYCDNMKAREPCSNWSGGGVESLDATESGVAVVLGEGGVGWVSERKGQSGKCVELSAL